MKRLRLVFLSFGLGLVLAGAPLADAAAQCPMCRINVRASMANGPGGKGYGLNTGITYLLVVPYLMAGGVAVLLWRGYNQRRRRYQPVIHVG